MGETLLVNNKIEELLVLQPAYLSKNEKKQKFEKSRKNS